MTRSEVFRAGDVLNGYRLLEDFRVVGAGLSEWSFAERGGREYFIKRFLSPTYPEADAPGSERIKAEKRARCAAFEAHHRGIQAAMAPLTTYGGNLIATLDFFRIGAKYYKVTEKVDVAGLQTRDIAALDFPARLVLLKTVAHSLKILHRLRIVHSDLKPGNVLVKRTELGYTTKLIDFDSSYIAGNPPPPEEIVGTMNYYSPELVRYIQGSAAPGELTEAADIFALGLIYAEYLTGAMPPFDPAHHEPAIAVLHGQPLKLGPSRAPTPITDLVERMLLPDPAARPSVTQVHSTLMSLRGGTAPSTTARAPVPIRPPSCRATAQRLLRPPAACPAAPPRYCAARGCGSPAGPPQPVHLSRPPRRPLRRQDRTPQRRLTRRPLTTLPSAREAADAHSWASCSASSTSGGHDEHSLAVQRVRGGQPRRRHLRRLRGGDDTPVSRGHRRPGPPSASPDAVRPSGAAPTTCEAGDQP